ncbi:MAG: DUF1667 domain-containing protein [Corallococcus sp.]|nr:DUF1667 domain-containing protein [Corallococcus sp.]MCM1358909.1 DUF1667 domain-containing protein [Corallococcus sp.]MCM1394897.1 DUF1667 domain-containing protein [Corallococcus sp.]
MELVCIVCPNGCRMQVEQTDGKVNVSGARCKRGEKFALAELTCPMRTVTSVVKTNVKGYPVISVKTDGEIPKNQILPLVKLLSGFTIEKPVPSGTPIIKNVLGTKVNVVTTTSMEDIYE